MIASQSAIKEFILNCEQQYEVAEWRIGEIEIWPFVRINLYIHMLSTLGKEGGRTDQESEPKIQEPAVSSKLSRLLNLPLEWIKLNRFYSGLNHKALVFFGSHIHRSQSGENSINRFFDPMIMEYGLEEQVYMLEYGRINSKSFNAKAIIPLRKHLASFKKLKRVWAGTSKWTTTDMNLSAYDAFLAELQSMGIDYRKLRIDQKALLNWANKIQSASKFFLKVFSRIRPERIFYLGYYGLDDLYASLLAANQLGISTVDFQHGPQTNVHMAFADWSKIPKDGYKLMPTEFWNWDDRSKAGIDQWASEKKMVTARVVGHPHLGHWYKHDRSGQTDRNQILYTLQTHPFEISSMLSSPIAELIRSGNYNWMLRLHPRSHFSQEELRAYISENGLVEKVSIQAAVESPLPLELDRSILHITNFSGCLIEAKLLQVPTVLVHPIGQEIFQNYIDYELIYYLNPSQENFKDRFFEILSDHTHDHRPEVSLNIYNPLVN